MVLCICMVLHIEMETHLPEHCSVLSNTYSLALQLYSAACNTACASSPSLPGDVWCDDGDLFLKTHTNYSMCTGFSGHHHSYVQTMGNLQALAGIDGYPSPRHPVLPARIRLLQLRGVNSVHLVNSVRLVRLHWLLCDCTGVLRSHC